MREAIPYSEIIKKWNDNDVEFWNDVKSILDTIHCRNKEVDNDWKRKLSNLVNNYIIIKSILVKHRNFKLIEPEQESLHYGLGKTRPDFIDNKQVTYELLTFKDRRNYDRRIVHLHEPDYTISYIRDEGILIVDPCITSTQTSQDPWRNEVETLQLYRGLMPKLNIDL